jgi:peptidoglycan/LPS O-acetylase OafA/YrhL
MKQKSISSLTGLVIKRLPRLGIPVLFSTVFSYLLVTHGLMFNHEAAIIQKDGNTWLDSFYSFEPSIKDMIKSIPNVFLRGDSSYNGPFWTMRWEFIGSYFIVIFILALHFSKTIRSLVYG